MVRAETGTDERHVVGRRVVHRQVPVGPRVGKHLRGRMIGPRQAVRRVLRPAYAGGQPDAGILVKHRVVNVRPAVPDRLLAPVGRRRHRRTGRQRGVGVPHRHAQLPDAVAGRVEHWHVVGAGFEGPVDRPVRVDGRIALVGRHLIVKIGVLVGPIPLCDHDVALDALGPWRRRRKLAGHDASGPVGVHLEGAPAAHSIQRPAHAAAGLP